MTPKTKLIFILSVLYLAGAIGTFAVVLLTVDKLGNSLINQVQVIADRYAKEQKYTELSDLVAETAVEREQLTHYLLSEKDTISFLANVESIGAEQGLVFSTNSLQVIEHPNAENILEARFGMMGTASQVAHMLTILESLPYDSELTQLTLTRGETDTKLDVTVQITLFE